MLFIIVVLIGLIKNNKKTIYIAIGVLYILSTPVFSNNFFKIVESSEYRKPISAMDSVDAIVVLSGMLKINEQGNSTYIEWGDPDRFFGGIALFKAGKSQKLIFTGSKLPWDKSMKTEGDVLKEYAIENGIPSEKIFITKNVKNTEDEALALKEFKIKNKKIILVTSAYHMYRAKRQFEKAGYIVITYCVDYKTKSHEKINILNFIPSSNNLALVELGLREIIGRIFYLCKYYSYK